MVFLALGTNIGDREENLRIARDMIRSAFDADIVCSDVMRTEAMGFDGPCFLNQIVALETGKGPFEVLGICQGIETGMGRLPHGAVWNESGERIYENRIIDIDILTYNDMKMTTERLTLPHPQCYGRPYVAELMKTFDKEIYKNYKI